MKSSDDASKRNRKNALSSTGPKTPEGKARSSVNAISHGLRSGRTVIPGEDFQEWRGFEEAVVSDLGATSQTEKAVASHVASALWRLFRGARYEAEVVHQNMSEESLEKAYEAHLNELHFLIRGRYTSAGDVAKAGTEFNEALLYLDWYNNTLEFSKSLSSLDPSGEIDVDYPEEIGKLVKAPPAAVKAITDRGDTARVQDVLDLLSMGKVSLERLIKFFEKRLNEKTKEVARLKEKKESLEASYKTALTAFSATRLIPQTEEVNRLQAYEAHLYRNLQRSLETFKLLQEIKSSPADIKTTAKVASFVKKPGKS